ncbi:MAG: C40 family peptidase [Roseburia sp.]|nr:C40 family peptidase [Roseburia sp.]MCM1097393.1 C40 family peptidase [Ruminococcus flavefaciens]
MKIRYGKGKRIAVWLLAVCLLWNGDAAPLKAAENSDSREKYAGRKTSAQEKSSPEMQEEEKLDLMYGGIWQVLMDSRAGAVVSAQGTSGANPELQGASPATGDSLPQEISPGAGASVSPGMTSETEDRAGTLRTTAQGQFQEEEDEENEYADFAIANVAHYVNVRKEATTGSAVLGKIYSGAVAQIQETVEGEDGQWFRIISGNVEGYIKSEYFLYGQAAAEAIDDYVTRYATVIVTRLNVRKEPDITSKRLGFLDNGEKLKILETDGDWLKVEYTDDKTGYVAAEYVTVSEEFVYAKTLEEEAAELAARRALEDRQKVSEEQAAEKTEITVTPPSGNYGDNAELRAEIVAYAMQFLGNRYVHGGSSLTTGTDCSGFTSLIYADFGYSISRTPSGQLNNSGRSISYSEIQPGDIICYGSKKCTHVGLYIGDGQIIHAANRRKGVITSPADYDHILGVKNIID